VFDDDEYADEAAEDEMRAERLAEISGSELLQHKPTTMHETIAVEIAQRQKVWADFLESQRKGAYSHGA
jgi:hypothetical protein